MNKFTTLLIALAVGALAANAVPAKRIYREYTQPDGSRVSAMLVGDEFGHYYQSRDGVRMMMDAEGTLRYVTLKADGTFELSPMAAAEAEARTPQAHHFVEAIPAEQLAEAMTAHRARRNASSKNARLAAPAKTTPAKAAPQYGLGLFTSSYPRKGQVRSLVFLVQYKDVKFKVTDPKTYFDNMLNQEGFDQYGATGSARDYFLEQSHDQFVPHFDVYGPVTLANNMSYYGGNDSYGNDLRPEEMVTEAARALASQIDFSQYDLDNNGKVDNIYVIYAGLGEADGGTANTVWPHSWEIENGPVYNGKKIYGYACSNEITGGVPNGIGTFCHEYSHVLGLPDLYATYYNHYNTPGEWSIMDSGSYNNDGRTPPHYGAFERNALGWMEPIIVDGPESVELHSLGESNTAYLIPTEKSNEFFLLENRQQQGSDTYLPGHGMLIWHIDFDQSVWDSNQVNNNSRHQYVDIEEACGYVNVNAPEKYTFPGPTKKTSFTATTSPALKSWANKGIDFPITDITEDHDGVIRFNISGGRIDLPTPATPTLVANPDGTLTAAWTAVEGAAEYAIWVYSKGEKDVPVTVGDFLDFNVGNVLSYTIAGLEPSTTYFVRVRAAIGRNASDYSDEASAVTPDEIDFIYRAPVATSAIFDPDSRTALLNWEAFSDAEAYLLTVESMHPGGESTIEVPFAFNSNESAIELPDGWSFTGNLTDMYGSASNGYFGQSAPAIKFANNNIELTSPMFDNDITALSFWLRGASTNSTSSFEVLGRPSTDYDWATVTTVTPMSQYNNKGSIFTPTVPGGLRQLKFLYHKNKGNCSLDDIAITTLATEYAATIDALNVGDKLSHEVTIDTPDETKMRFYVEALDGDGRRSLRSNVVDFAIPAGVNSPVCSADISLNGRTLTVTAPAGTPVRVFTPAGLTLYSAVSTGAPLTIELPAGICIVAAPTATRLLVR